MNFLIHNPHPSHRLNSARMMIHVTHWPRPYVFWFTTPTQYIAQTVLNKWLQKSHTNPVHVCSGSPPPPSKPHRRCCSWWYRSHTNPVHMCSGSPSPPNTSPRQWWQHSTCSNGSFRFHTTVTSSTIWLYVYLCSLALYPDFILLQIHKDKQCPSQSHCSV